MKSPPLPGDTGRRRKRGAMFNPTKEEFKKKCREGNLIPVSAEIMADLETPVSAFLKLGGGLLTRETRFDNAPLHSVEKGA